MTNIETFTKDLGSFLILDKTSRTNYLKKCYEGYLQQAAEIGYSREDIVENLKRLISFVVCSDGDIATMEQDIVREAIYETKTNDEIKEMCLQYATPEELETLFIFARRMFKEFGKDSFFYMIGVILITADEKVRDEELQKFSQLFGLNR